MVLAAGTYHAHEMPVYVINQAATVYAAFTKRAWINWVSPDVPATPELIELKESMHADINRLLQSESGYSAVNAASGNEETRIHLLKEQLLGLAVIEALVTEFECSRKASSMDVGSESHMECFSRFEMEDLGNLFVSVVSMLMALTLSSDPLECEVFSKSLQLCTRILTWPFGQIWQILGIQFVTNSFSHPCRPPPHWRAFLVTPEMEVLSYYSKIYGLVRSIDAQLTHIVCEGLLQLASLSGDIFGTNEEARLEPRRAWISSFLEVLMSILSIEGLSNVEMRDVAQITQRFFGCTTLSNMLEAVGPEMTEQVLTACTYRTEETMSRLAKVASPEFAHLNGVNAADHFEDEDVEDTVIGDALDTWLTAWASWSTDVMTTTPFPPLQTLMFRVFNSYVLARLEIAKAELAKVNENDWDDTIKAKQDLSNPIISGQLANAAAIGRMSPRTSCEFLKTTLAGVAGPLRVCVENSDLSETAEHHLEELHWLLMIIGHFLCLINLGELASIPLAINRLCNTHDEQGETNQVIELINTVFEVITLENSAMDHMEWNSILVWSPLVAETLSWFLAHWSSCYLLLSETSTLSMSASLQAEYGQTSSTAHGILDSLLRKIVRNLMFWRGETNVLSQTCHILNLISRLDTLNMSLLMKLSGWNELFSAWTSGSAEMNGFPPKVQRRLMLALSHIVQADGVDDQLAYLNALVVPIDTLLSETLGDTVAFAADFQNPMRMNTLQIALERIRGLFKSTRGRTFKAINEIASRYFTMLVDVIILYKDHHPMKLLVLKILSDYAEYVLACTYEESNMVDFHQAISNLIAQAGPTSLFKRHAPRPGQRSGEADARDEQVEEMLQVLRLLCRIVENEGEDPARISFHGLEVIVSPYMDDELLAYPKLCKHYFHFVTLIFSAHAEYLSNMSDSLFESILHAMQIGLHQVDDYIQMAALEAVAKIARFNWKMSTQKNIEILGTKRPILGAWIDVFLRWILFDDGFKADIIMATAPTYLALVLCETDTYRATVHSIISEQTDPTVQQRLDGLFNSLLANIEPVWNPTTKQAFLDNFRQFVPVARGMLHRR